jgi:hypothetical protein
VQVQMVSKLVDLIAQMPDSHGSELLAARVLFECCGLCSMQKLKMKENENASQFLKMAYVKSKNGKI